MIKAILLAAGQSKRLKEENKLAAQETIYLKRLLSDNQQDLRSFTEYINNFEKGKNAVVALSTALNGPSKDSVLVQAAKDYGMWVAVHAHGAEGMKRAVIAGVDSVEHGTFMTEEVMDLMIKNGTYYVPTISAGEFVAEKSKIDNYFPEIVRPKAANV